MAAAAISIAPRGLIPYIRFNIDKLTTGGYTIRKISLEIVGKPFVQETGKLVYYHRYTVTNITTFDAAFNKNSHSTDLIKIFREFTESLRKMGSFAELTCKTTIEAARDLGDGTTNVRTMEVEGCREGHLSEAAAWEEKLFSTAAAALPKPDQTAASDSTPPAKK